MSNLDRPARSGGTSMQVANEEPTAEERAAAAAVLGMIGGIHISRAVYVAAELGIADILASGPRTAAQLSEATRTHQPSLYRVLRLLASLGVLIEHENRSFSLTVLGDRLRADVPASMRSWAMLTESIGGVQAFERIIETVRTGKPGFDIVHRMTIFDFIDQHPQQTQGFQAAMSERTAALARSVARGYDFSSMRAIADIGGGTGTLLVAILRAHGHLCGVLLERPAATAEASGVLRAAGVADRCEIAAGDFFQGVPEGADGYILANVLHDWDDVRAVQILRMCQQAVARHGRVLIIERLIPAGPADAVPVLVSDLNMLVFTGGQERTTAQYGQLLVTPGNLGKVQAVAPPYGVIEGTRATYRSSARDSQMPQAGHKLSLPAGGRGGAVGNRYCFTGRVRGYPPQDHSSHLAA